MGGRKLHRVGGNNIDPYPPAARINKGEVQDMIDALTSSLALTDDQLTALAKARVLSYTSAAGARDAMEYTLEWYKRVRRQFGMEQPRSRSTR